MKGLREKFRKHGGFTLVEMLIVVAIIAILIAVSIPLVNDSLEKARHAVDDANERSAAGLASVVYLTNSADAGDELGYYVNATHQGALGKGVTGVESACKCGGANEGKHLYASFDKDGVVTTTWK